MFYIFDDGHGGRHKRPSEHVGYGGHDGHDGHGGHVRYVRYNRHKRPSGHVYVVYMTDIFYMVVLVELVDMVDNVDLLETLYVQKQNLKLSPHSSTVFEAGRLLGIVLLIHGTYKDCLVWYLALFDISI